MGALVSQPLRCRGRPRRDPRARVPAIAAPAVAPAFRDPQRSRAGLSRALERSRVGGFRLARRPRADRAPLAVLAAGEADVEAMDVGREIPRGIRFGVATEHADGEPDAGEFRAL